MGALVEIEGGLKYLQGPFSAALSTGVGLGASDSAEIDSRFVRIEGPIYKTEAEVRLDFNNFQVSALWDQNSVRYTGGFLDQNQRVKNNRFKVTGSIDPAVLLGASQ
jgi:hypothetical protein